MKVYENNYVYGRDLLKKLLIAAVIAAVGTVVAQPGSGLYFGAFVVAMAAFVTGVVVIFKYCRCPHCGKVIFLGVLALEICPKCRYNFITGKKVKKSKRK